MSCWDLVLLAFSHIFEGHFTGTGAILWYNWFSASEATLKDIGKYGDIIFKIQTDVIQDYEVYD